MPVGAQQTAQPFFIGTITSILWVQELMYDDFLIWTTESRSPARRPMTVQHGQIVRIVLDEEWRATNRIPVEAGV